MLAIFDYVRFYGWQLYQGLMGFISLFCMFGWVTVLSVSSFLLSVSGLYNLGGGVGQVSFNLIFFSQIGFGTSIGSECFSGGGSSFNNTLLISQTHSLMALLPPAMNINFSSMPPLLYQITKVDILPVKGQHLKLVTSAFKISSLVTLILNLRLLTSSKFKKGIKPSGNLLTQKSYLSLEFKMSSLSLLKKPDLESLVTRLQLIYYLEEMFSFWMFVLRFLSSFSVSYLLLFGGSSTPVISMPIILYSKINRFNNVKQSNSQIGSNLHSLDQVRYQKQKYLMFVQMNFFSIKKIIQRKLALIVILVELNDEDFGAKVSSLWKICACKSIMKFVCIILLKIYIEMSIESQIIELTGLSPFQIINAIEKLIEENDFSRFTLLISKKPKQVERNVVRPTSASRFSKKESFLRNSRCLQNYSKFSPQSSQFLAPLDENYISLNRGLNYYYDGQFEQALNIFQREEQQLRQSTTQAQKAKVYQDVVFHLGNCYYRLKNYEKAIQHFSRKFSGEDLKQQGQKLNNLGSCHAHLKQQRLSLNSYAQALKIYSEFPEVDCSNLLNNLGMLYAQSCMYETAEKYFTQSIEERKAKSADTLSPLYSTYMQLGNCQMHSNKYNDAIASLMLAQSLAQKGYGNLIQTLNQLANIYQLAEQWRMALDCYQKLSQIETKRGYLFERAAYLHRYMGHHSDYERFIEKAFECYKQENNQRKLSELSHLQNRIRK